MLKSFSGQDGRLTVTVKPNLPRVQCALSDRPPVAEICEHVVLGDMPASKAQQVFGNRGTSGIDVRVPWAMATCEIHTSRVPLF